MSSNDEEEIKVLIQKLREGTAGEKAEAVRRGWKMGEKAVDAVPELRKLLNGPEEIWIRLYPDMKENVVRTLGAIGDASAIPDLNERLYDVDDNPCVRICAAYALGEIGVDALPALREALKSEEDDLRYWATLGLGHMGGKAEPAALDLLEMVCRDENENVAKSAAEALRRIGEKAADAVPALKILLNDPIGRVRVNAAKALGKIVGREAIQLIMECAVNEDAEMRTVLKEICREIADGSLAGVRMTPGNEFGKMKMSRLTIGAAKTVVKR